MGRGAPKTPWGAEELSGHEPIEVPANRALPGLRVEDRGSPLVVCHAGGRWFESGRSRFGTYLQISTWCCLRGHRLVVDYTPSTQTFWLQPWARFRSSASRPGSRAARTCWSGRSRPVATRSAREVDPDGAEEIIRAAYSTLKGIGEKSIVSTVAADLADFPLRICGGGRARARSRGDRRC